MESALTISHENSESETGSTSIGVRPDTITPKIPDILKTPEMQQICKSWKRSNLRRLSLTTSAVSSLTATSWSSPSSWTSAWSWASPATTSTVVTSTWSVAGSSTTSLTIAAHLSFAHLVLGESLPHITSVSVDHMRLLENALIDGIVIVECDESEATWLLGGLVENNLGLETLRRHIRFGAILVVTWNGTLRIDSLSIDNVWSLLHSGVHLGLGGESDESESTGSLCGWISHHNNVSDLSELRVELSHQVIGGVRGESSDENLSEILWLQVCVASSILQENRLTGGTGAASRCPTPKKQVNKRNLSLDFDVRHDSSS
ncbi:hypothetical protein GCK72_015846 [Caenorhabditis remanei]|uniref:Uncharacterized protein n=1 Tax=Caenorhabditis remanei TaxID=31234 RepID=A0A6A5GXM5_CAERE|nr:hypothetical protein GCK72_015846 [Caenorhabditis remanei]KAF1759379.1 hypothetical protein GCK72_015846 [Caenorhabditis remanei]